MASTFRNTADTHSVRTGIGSVVVDVNALTDNVQSVTLQPDGKVLLAGFSQHNYVGYSGAPGDESYGTRSDRTVVRLNADGSLDTTFGKSGIAVLPANLDREDATFIMAVQADGKVLFADHTAAGFNVQRFNLDGSLDSTFGTKGALLLALDYYPEGSALDVNPDGTFYISTRGEHEAELFKSSKDGILVDSFGEHGRQALNPTGEYHNGNITTAVQADGGVVMGSWLYVGGYDVPGSDIHIPGDPVYSLQRFKPDGTMDTRFGDNGTLHLNPALGLSYYSEVALQADGKIVLVGEGTNDAGTILRLNTDGSFDTTFGDGGKTTFAPIGDDTGYAHWNDARSVTVQPDGKIVVAGTSSLNVNAGFSAVRLNADGSLDTTFGSQDGAAHLEGSGGQNTLLGINTAEVIHALAGDDLLQGNGGRDVLAGGAGADIFRYAQISDSYRTATQTGSDRILDFDPAQDRIDLTKLGFTGIGDGHNGTLAVTENSEGTRTYLKSYEANADGQRFELVLDGGLADRLTDTQLVFSTPTVYGTEKGDVITGSAFSEILRGLDGNDTINGGIGSDVIVGGAGADRLNGGDDLSVQLFNGKHENDDTFLYTAVSDSYRTDTKSMVDLIVDFADYSDKIDVSALGYTGFGDGTGTTLKVAYNQALNRTYLKDMEADAQGHRFEISMTGNWSDELDNSNMVFAPDHKDVTLVGVATDTAHDGSVA
jgi:serralysin